MPTSSRAQKPKQQTGEGRGEMERSNATVSERCSGRGTGGGRAN